MSAILDGYEKSIANESGRRFREWASLFSGKLFVQIVVYADETGTQGIQPGGKEPAPGVYGFMDTVDSWGRFRVEWVEALKKHHAPYFHFRELHPKLRSEKKRQFYGWSDQMVDDFIHDMAIVASRTAVPFGGNTSEKYLAVGKTRPEIYAIIFHQFFKDFISSLDAHRPNFTGRASFFFDDNKNEEWIAVLNTVIKSWQEKDQRIGEYAAVKMKEERGIPCQAADLLAYLSRQGSETVYETNQYHGSRVLDMIINRSAFTKDNPRHKLALMPDSQWIELIKTLREAKREWEISPESITDGIMGTPNYYKPFSHPFFKTFFTEKEIRKMMRISAKVKRSAMEESHYLRRRK
ncbi:MAG: hypothetical protein ABSG78_23585 [Verrucomicrobiota bacterium]|jgi:hypothetical protein